MPLGYQLEMSCPMDWSRIAGRGIDKHVDLSTGGLRFERVAPRKRLLLHCRALNPDSFEGNSLGKLRLHSVIAGPRYPVMAR